MPPLPIDLARKLIDAAEQNFGATMIDLFPTKTTAQEPEKLPEGPWTVKQAAKALNVSERTVRSLVADGKLKSHKVGAGRGVVRILPEDVEEFQRATATEPKSAKPLPRHW